MSKVRHSFLILVSISLMALSLFADDEIYTDFFSSKALDGHDPVAYFSMGKPTKGSDEFSLKYRGAVWNFHSMENLRMFKEDPEKYAPQYGGHCSWAVSRGYHYKGDPLVWKIYNGKLYLNYNLSIQDKWLRNIDRFISKADTLWPKMADKK